MTHETYDALRDRTRAAIFMAMSAPSEFDDINLIESQLMEGAFEVVEATMPKPGQVDAAWVIGMLEARPKLLDEGVANQSTVAESMIWAVGNRILAELEPEIFEHARRKGFEMPAAPTP